MNFMQAVKELSQGGRVRRTDWAISPRAFISVLEHFHVDHVYITGKYSTDPDMVEGYGITWSDINSDMWEIVQK